MLAVWAVVIIVQNPINILAVIAYYDVHICVHTMGYLMQAANELAADNVGQFHLREARELSANELSANELSANELSAKELSAKELAAKSSKSSPII
jgi:hypothetical protein